MSGLLVIAAAALVVWMVCVPTKDSRAMFWARTWEKKKGRGLSMGDSQKARLLAKEEGGYAAFNQRTREYLGNKENLCAMRTAVETLAGGRQ